MSDNTGGADATERAISDALFALLCDCPDDGSCRPECAANNGYIDMGPLAIQALRLLPVERRMEAMGMERVDAVLDGCGDDECCGSYVTIEPDPLGDLWRERRDPA